ncbi:MAG: dicarboxylate/amino acid:cation symporter [Planctomycetes bacterium]|nr:dicarboxylate/amino acid:cation symporter [Planctomycetota bacterium]
MAKTPFHRTLYFWVILAIALGVVLGHAFPEFGTSLKPLGDGFIRLVKMIIAPIIFCSVVLGIAGLEDLKKVGKTGGLGLLYFEIVTTLALVVGLIVINVAQPGAGMHIDPDSLDTTAVAEHVSSHSLPGTIEFILHIIPVTVVDAFARGEILQVLFFSILFGFALHQVGGRNTALFTVIEQISEVLFTIVGFLMKVAPVGACGAMAFTVGKYGLGTLLSLGKLLATFYATCFIFIFGVLGLIAWWHGFSIWKLLKYLREELLIVLGTSSSEAALPRMMAKLEALGVSKPAVGLLIPTGYSFNLDGTSIYLTMAAVFIAQATDTPLPLSRQLALLGVLLLTSKGAAGVTGSGFIVLAATLSAVGDVPVTGLALILGIDRFMSEARALTNLIGNGVGTLVVAGWTGDLNREKLHRELNGLSVPESR